jgi:hypothetical protein
MNKRKKILSWIPSILITVIIGGGAIMKLSAAPPLVDLFTQIGLLPYLPWLGVAELLFMVIFLYNRSMNIGLLLLTGYFGGAMAVELSHGTVPFAPGIILSGVWIAAYVRNTSIFKSSTSDDVKSLTNAAQ